MASNRTELPVDTIVQKSTRDDAVEQRVAQPGGLVTKHVSIINGFAAEVQAKQILELAFTQGLVDWVSLVWAPVDRGSDY
jgi:hypothetical protein